MHGGGGSFGSDGAAPVWILAPGTATDLRAVANLDPEAEITLGHLCAAISRRREHELGRRVVLVPYDFESMPAGRGLTRALICDAQADFVFFAAFACAEIKAEAVLAMLRELVEPGRGSDQDIPSGMSTGFGTSREVLEADPK